MSNTVNQVNKIVRNVVALEAIRRVRLALIILLLVEFLVRFFYRYAITELVFVIWLTAAPFLLGQIMKKDKTKEQSQELPVLCKKYRYNYKELISQLIVCIVCLLYLMVQLYANIHSSIPEGYIVYAPVVYAFGALVGFVGLYMYIKRKIGNELENNQL